MKKESAEKYVQMLSELKNHYVFFDLHVHPFEFFFCEIKYVSQDRRRKIFCLENANFKSPDINDFHADSYESGEIPTSSRADFFRLIFARQFQCTGQGVFRAYSHYTGIQCYGLLLVAQTADELEKQLKLTHCFFPDQNSFFIAGTVPGDISNAKIFDYLKWQKENYGIKMVKIHPNAAGMNLEGQKGIQRIERILESCGQLALPVIVHAGRNSILRSRGTADFAILRNLRKINWQISKSKVILAHGGIYDLERNEITEALKDLKILLDKYENLMYDISGLSFYQMIELIKAPGLERAIFGSDALYFSPIKSVANFLQALEKLCLGLEQNFIQVAHRNPLTFLNNDKNDNRAPD